MSELERRYQPGTVALRGGDGVRRLGGYALKWNTLSRNLGGFVETIAPGAATKTLSERPDVLCRFQHKDDYLLGRSASGTLRMHVDDVGLDYEVDLPDTSAGRDVGALAERGDLRHSSFAFYTVDDGWDVDEHGFPLRTLREFKLVDVAPVVDPAYLDTSSGLRSLAAHRGLSVEEVLSAAQAERLAELLRAKPTVIDLGVTTSPAESRDDDGTGPAENHPGLLVIDARRAFEGRRAS